MQINRSIAIVCKEHLYPNKKKTHPIEKWAENRHRLYPEKKKALALDSEFSKRGKVIHK